MFSIEKSTKNISLIIVQMPLLPHLIFKEQVNVLKALWHSNSNDNRYCTRYPNRVNRGHCSS